MTNLTLLQRIALIIRKVHLLPLGNLIWFFKELWSSSASNRNFRNLHRNLPIPPLLLLYDIQGNCDVAGFHDSGYDHSIHIRKLIDNALPERRLRVLEWGCGPARVLQHLYQSVGDRWELWGADYNPRTIAWCHRHWPGIRFIRNFLEPPLPVDEGFFDVVYCISVFTHLSEKRHYQWQSEILRLLKPGGLFIVTFHGQEYRSSLTDSEQERFDRGELVTREKTREGKKDFSAYHADAFVELLLRPFVQVRKCEGIPGFRQSVWLCRKNYKG